MSIAHNSKKVTYLTLEELERCSTTGGNVAERILLASVGNNSSSVTTTDDNSRSVLDGLDGSIEQSGRSASKVGELEYTGRSVPKDSLGLGNSLGEELSGFWSSVKTHPLVWDTRFVSGRADL